MREVLLQPSLEVQGRKVAIHDARCALIKLLLSFCQESTMKRSEPAKIYILANFKLEDLDTTREMTLGMR